MGLCLNYSDIILETRKIGIHNNVDKPPASISSLSGQLKKGLEKRSREKEQAR